MASIELMEKRGGGGQVVTHQMPMESWSIRPALFVGAMTGFFAAFVCDNRLIGLH